MWRQGDVLIKRIERIPKGAKPKDGLVVMEGEATGHAHRLSNGELYEKDGKLYFGVAETADLVHEEHGTIPLKAGYYEVVRQREFDAFDRKSINVRD